MTDWILGKLGPQCFQRSPPRWCTSERLLNWNRDLVGAVGAFSALCLTCTIRQCCMCGGDLITHCSKASTLLKPAPNMEFFLLQPSCSFDVTVNWPDWCCQPQIVTWRMLTSYHCIFLQFWHYSLLGDLICRKWCDIIAFSSSAA